MTIPPSDRAPIPMGNLFRSLPDAGSPEITELLASSPLARVERITSHGQASPPDFWYEQEEDEFVILLAGAAGITWADGTETEMGPGDWVWIPAHTRHRVSRTSDREVTIWLAVFMASS